MERLIEMKVLKSYKTELKPNHAQAEMLKKTADAARFTWNWALSQRIKEYKETGRSLTAKEQCKQIVILKKSELKWLSEVSKCVPQEALTDLDRSYESFFRRLKLGEKPSLPKFKEKHKTTPAFRTSDPGAITDTHVFIPKIGFVRLKEHGYIPICLGQKHKSGGHKFITVKMTRSGRWFVYVQCEIEAEDPPKRGQDVLGIDLGLKSFAVTSDGENIEHHKTLEKFEDRLKRAHRKIRRKELGGKNREKARKKYAVLHYKVACARRDFLHKLSSRLVRTKPVIVLEKLNIKGMLKGRRFSKNIGDSGWGMFSGLCKRKTEWSGGKVIVADRWFCSSKRCSNCGHIYRNMALSDRKWVCKACGTYHDRDLNAALNLKWYGEMTLAGKDPMAIVKAQMEKQKKAANTASPAGINACGEAASTLKDVRVQGMQPRLKQEVSKLSQHSSRVSAG